MARLEPDHVDFLLRTSILDTLSGPLSHAVLGHGGSGRILATLARSNVLLVSLDRGGTQLPVSPSVQGDAASRKLRRLDPGREPGATRAREHVVRRARRSRFGHPARGRRPRPLSHCGQLLSRHACSYKGHGRNDALRELADDFNDDQLAAVPSLAVAAASQPPGCRGRRAGAPLDPRPRPAAWHDALLDQAIPARAAPSCCCARCSRGAAWCTCAAKRRAPARWSRSTANRASFSRLLAGAVPSTGRRPRTSPRRTWTTAHARALWRPRTSRRSVSPSLHCSKLTRDDWDVAAILRERARSRVGGCGLAEYPIVALVYAVSALTRSHSGPVADARSGPAHGRAGWSTSSWTSFRGTRPRRASRSRARRSA